MTTFRELGVLPDICDALDRAGITTPFAIQEMTLSVALMGTDLIGQARTGTGKTLAFGIPVLQRSVAPKDPAYADMPQGKPQALIVAPTRELALQVSNDLHLASKDLGLRVLTVYGGVGYDAQLEALETGVDIVVGTPGRLIDLANRRSLDLSHVHALVLDEADEMLDLGFLPDVITLISKTPETRQTMLFSATMPAAIVSLARIHMRHPMNIRAESSYDTTMVPATAQFIYQAHDLDKPEIIGRVLQAEDAEKIIVFTRTKRQAQRVADDLAERGFLASPLHGDMAQVAREKALAKFREDKIRVLVATDVAARGIDVRGVSHVINYTCPEDDKTYVHRIGRTGRAGATGTAITFVDWADLHRWKMINKTLDLPFDEPQETYSTSEHLFHDQGIPAGTKGRIVDPAPVEKKERAPRERRSGSGSARARAAAAPTPRPRRSPATHPAAATATAVAPAVASRSRPPRPDLRPSGPLLRASGLLRHLLLGAGGPLDEVLGDLAVGVGALAAATRGEDRPAGGRGLGELDRLGDRRLDDLEVVGLADRLQHRAGVVGAAVVERRQHAPHLEAAVGEAAYVVDGVEQLADPAVRQRLALQRDQHAVGGRERGDRQHAERGRAVEQHPVVRPLLGVLEVLGELLERALDDVLAPGAGEEVGLGAGELDRGRQDVDALLGLDDDLDRVDTLGQDVVDRGLEVLGVDAEREGQAGLRVEVDQQHAVPELGQRGADRGDGRGLRDPALLVGDGQRDGGRSPALGAHCRQLCRTASRAERPS